MSKETHSDSAWSLGQQEEYKKIDLTLVCADGSKVDIPGAGLGVAHFLQTGCQTYLAE